MLDPQHGAAGLLGVDPPGGGRVLGGRRGVSATEMARVGWPSLPAGVLVDEIRDWWDASRQRVVATDPRLLSRAGPGRDLAGADRLGRLAGPPSDPLAVFQHQERAAIVLAVEKLLDELDRLAQVGNDTLRPRLQRLLGGHARATLLARVQTAHESLPAVDEHYRAFLRAELDAWRRSNPRAVRFLQSLDHAAAVARPAITVALFLPACILPATWSVRRPRRPPAYRRPSGHRGGHHRRHHRRRRSLGEHHQRRRSPGGRRLSAGCNPATHSSAPAGWPIGSNANCSAICWPISAAARTCPREEEFREVESVVAGLTKEMQE